MSAKDFLTQSKSTYAVFSDELFREKIPFKPHLFVASLVNNGCGQQSVLLENLGFFGNSQGCIIYFSFRARVQHWDWYITSVINPMFMCLTCHLQVNLCHLLLRSKWGNWLPLKFNSMITGHACVCLHVHWKVYFGLCTLSCRNDIGRLWKFWCTAITIVSDNMREMAIKFGTKLFLT